MSETSMTRLYTVHLRHDGGTVTLETAFSSACGAVESIIKAERAPLGAVEWVRVRPVCDFCDRPATRYVRDSGDGTPLCTSHATEQYGSRSASVGMLGVTRLEPVPLAQWAEQVDLMRQYGNESGYVITDHEYAEQDAHTVTWFTADGCVWLALKRSPRGLWGIETSDYVRLAKSNYDRRFPCPDAAVEWAAERVRVAINEVEEW